MTVPNPTLVAQVATLLPPDAESTYNWDQAKIVKVMVDNGFGVARTVRFYWLERVNETVEFMNIDDKSLLQLHTNAKAMLAYWDAIIAANGDDGGLDAIPETTSGPISFGRIERAWGRARR